MADLNLAPTRLAPTASVPQSQISKLAATLRSGGWSVVTGNGDCGGGGGGGRSSPGTQSSRTAHIMPCAVQAIRLVFTNHFTNGWGETPNVNQIYVRASIERQDPSGVNNQLGYDTRTVYFSGQRGVFISGTSVVISDPIWIGLAKGETLFVRTSASTTPIAAAPSAPTAVINTSGGSLPSGQTYQVGITYVFPGDVESQGSTTTQVSTTTGSANRIVVTMPANPNNGAIGCRVYTSLSGGTATSTLYLASGQIFTFGASMTPIFCLQGGQPASLQGAPQINNSYGLGFPVSGSTAGGTAAGGSNNGEGYQTDDVVDGPNVVCSVFGNVFGPVAVLGLTPIGVSPSIGIIGDSIAAGTGDNGFVIQRGGFLYRAATGQTTQYAYTPSIVPPFGTVKVATGGETASAFTAYYQSRIRRQLTQMCTHVYCNYGTNDLSSGSSAIASYLMPIAVDYVKAGVYFQQT
jgi:hypothetical protein